MGLLTERYLPQIRGVLSCWDRVVITGTLPQIGYAEAMTIHLRTRKIRVFDYTQFVQPLRDAIRDNAERLAQENNLEIDYIRRKDFRKEERVKAILAHRGTHPGLVHIFSALEPCTSFRPWHDKDSGKTYLKPTDGKCLHYYFYFIDEDLGLCYLRVPTWAPFRLQFYFNGHNYLANLLSKRGVAHNLVDNVFVSIDDWVKAQKLADKLRADRLHRRLNRMARRFCPIVRRFSAGYHWCLMQVEYATDIVFRTQADLKPLYDELTRTAIHAVKPDNVATFLGRKLTGNYQDELGNDFNTRIQGTRIRHHMGPVSIKMYDKLGLVLRIETTANKVDFFKHHRRVVHRDGSWEMKLAPLKKSIYSLPVLRELMFQSNRRYLEFISTLVDPTTGIKNLKKISQPARDQRKRSYRGFNLFLPEDLDLFEAIVQGQFNISGFQNKQLRQLLKNKTTSQIGRALKRLRMHGLIKKIAHSYKYYLTRLGRKVVAASLRLRRLFVIPFLAHLEFDA